MESGGFSDRSLTRRFIPAAMRSVSTSSAVYTDPLGVRQYKGEATLDNHHLGTEAGSSSPDSFRRLDLVVIAEPRNGASSNVPSVPDLGR